MNPAWITAAVAVLGMAAQGLWTVVNLRIENRLLKRVDQLKEWCDQRYVRRPDPGPFSAVSQHFPPESSRNLA